MKKRKVIRSDLTLTGFVFAMIVMALLFMLTAGFSPYISEFVNISSEKIVGFCFMIWTLCLFLAIAAANISGRKPKKNMDADIEDILEDRSEEEFLSSNTYYLEDTDAGVYLRKKSVADSGDGFFYDPRSRYGNVFKLGFFVTILSFVLLIGRSIFETILPVSDRVIQLIGGCGFIIGFLIMFCVVYFVSRKNR